jgi:hypothetical protein
MEQVTSPGVPPESALPDPAAMVPQAAATPEQRPVAQAMPPVLSDSIGRWWLLAIIIVIVIATFSIIG